jgi:hypothetical protein
LPEDGWESCVVARSAERGCGRVIAWGDEHVTNAGYAPASDEFWIRAIEWLADASACGLPSRRYVHFQFASESLRDALSARGFTLVARNADPAPEIRVVYMGDLGRSVAPAPREWLEAGGALLTYTVGTLSVADDSPCAGFNAALMELGFVSDCGAPIPSFPLLFDANGALAGMSADGAPFVAGSWIGAAAGQPSQPLAYAHVAPGAACTRDPAYAGSP